MNDAACVELLQWALPVLKLRWQGFRNVRGQVCKRLARRRAELGLADLAAYRRFLEQHAEEWPVLDAMCRVTISRFARDRAVWVPLVDEVLPRLVREAEAAGRARVRAWSAACGAGEEPYSLAIAWRLGVAPRGVDLEILATDVDEGQLARAAHAAYPHGTLRELPEAWRAAAFTPAGALERLREPFRDAVRFARHDVRTPAPAGPFDLVLCRNLAFTYFDEPVQRQVAASLRTVLRAGGVLVVGGHEQLPADVPGFAASGRSLYQAA